MNDNMRTATRISATIAKTTPPAIAPTLGPLLFSADLIFYIIILDFTSSYNGYSFSVVTICITLTLFVFYLAGLPCPARSTTTRPLT